MLKPVSLTPLPLPCAVSVSVTCIIWERNECKKVELTALDIGWAIIETVDKIPESSDYILIGESFTLLCNS